MIDRSIDACWCVWVNWSLIYDSLHFLAWGGSEFKALKMMDMKILFVTISTQFLAISNNSFDNNQQCNPSKLNCINKIAISF